MTFARTVRVAAGWALLVVGVLLLVLPGPGIPLLVLGLALLSRDVPWARRLRERVVERLSRARGGGSGPARPAQ
ncbi:MAG TPA: PGPGW domain-containing protein [Anaeromyxobacteraceae bacterium]|nr:PGPGW domain-containing protein [Anaeromyxobacteraceae bacterium]